MMQNRVYQNHKLGYTGRERYGYGSMEDGKVIIKSGGAGEVSTDGCHDSSRDSGLRQADGAAENMNVLVSGMLRHEGKTFVRVSFLRGKDWAEGIVPDGVIEKAEGFTEEEVRQLAVYLSKEKEMFLRQARQIDPIRNLFWQETDDKKERKGKRK